MKTFLISVAAMFIAGAAMAATPPRVPSSNPSAAALASPAPPGASVYFISPADGATVPKKFTVKFGLKGMSIAPAGTDEPNSGHHHLVIDLATLPDMTKPLPSNEHIMHFGKGQTETELTLPPGKHTLQLVFANYQHIPHSPPIVSKPITITVE
jgi:hypothetical protein